MILRRVSDGARVRLGPELGRGGEGAVFPVISPVIGDARVAKVYFKAPTPAKVEKLRVMARAATPALLRVAAWPIDLLEDENHRVRGFLMPRVAAREDAHELYSPKSRRRVFASADFRFVVRAAANVARAFASMHAAGHVIGDVNHGNALIGLDATVVLIDCDSFQVRDRAGRVFTCDVGVPLFTAPELQNIGFRGLRRSARHDAFGLAVLVFHLLFQGRHPFAGLYEGGEMPIERAIAESRFAYGAGTETHGMRAPPATLPLGAFGPGIATLFERAFAPAGEAARPEASEWVDALEALERVLVACAATSVHFHRHDAECCWCELEKASGVRLFGVAAAAALGKQALESLWYAIKAVRKPETDPVYSTPKLKRAMPRPPRWPRKSGRPDWNTIVFALGYFGVLLFLIQFPIWFFAVQALFVTGFVVVRVWRWIRRKSLLLQRTFRGRDLIHAEQAWNQLVSRWNKQCSSALFNFQLDRLQEARQELASWEITRRNELRYLRRELEARARDLHLGQFSIDPSYLRLSPAEAATLESFGFETAADVVRKMPELAKVLKKTKAMDVQAWASRLNSQFQFDPKAPPDPRLAAEVEQRLADRQRELLATLRDGPRLLERVRHEIEYARARMHPDMAVALKELRAARDKVNAVHEEGA